MFVAMYWLVSQVDSTGRIFIAFLTGGRARMVHIWKYSYEGPPSFTLECVPVFSMQTREYLKFDEPMWFQGEARFDRAPVKAKEGQPHYGLPAHHLPAYRCCQLTVWDRPRFDCYNLDDNFTPMLKPRRSSGLKEREVYCMPASLVKFGDILMPADINLAPMAPGHGGDHPGDGGQGPSAAQGTSGPSAASGSTMVAPLRVRSSNFEMQRPGGRVDLIDLTGGAASLARQGLDYQLPYDRSIASSFDSSDEMARSNARRQQRTSTPVSSTNSNTLYMGSSSSSSSSSNFNQVQSSTGLIPLTVSSTQTGDVDMRTLPPRPNLGTRGATPRMLRRDTPMPSPDVSNEDGNQQAMETLAILEEIFKEDNKGGDKEGGK